MSRCLALVFILTALLSAGCVSMGKIGRHNFESGYYELKTTGNKPQRIYAEIIEDSLIVYPVKKEGNKEYPDSFTSNGARISRIKSDSYFYNSCFRTNTLDIDLTTILFKSRHSMDDVPNQFSADLDFAVYLGFRKDFYKIVSPAHHFHEEKSFVRQTGFDLGVFAGIGSSPVNPTVTNNRITQQYDAMIFQKGFAGFFSFSKMSVGLAVGFDNLLDKNKSLWIYNQKPYLGLIISVSSF